MLINNSASDKGDEKISLSRIVCYISDVFCSEESVMLEEIRGVVNNLIALSCFKRYDPDHF